MTRWLSQLHAAFRSIVRRRRAERDLEDEMRYHLQLEIEAQRNAGLTPDEARYAALRVMGGIDKSKDECRDLRHGRLLSEFLTDLRYAGRALRRRPGSATLAIGIVALGIGANTAVFSVVNGVLLKSLPYPDANRIVALRTSAVKTGKINPLVALANFWDWRAQSSSFEAMAVYRSGDAPVTPADTAEFARHASVDVQLFRVFRVEPMIGRTLGPEDLLHESGHPVGMISHAYWQSRYGGDPRILQRTIRVGIGLRQIVGVMPPGFQFPNRTDVWTPQTNRTAASRTSHNLLAVARLRPGISPESANAELNTIAARLAQQYPDSNEGRGVSVALLQDQLVGDVRLMLYLMWGAVTLVLLIACANTATLLLANATARTREIAVRTALGASRRRIIRQLVTESLLLAIIAGTVGIALAHWGLQVLVALTPTDVVRLTDTRIDGGVLGFTLTVSVLTSLLFGLVPALHASKIDLADAVKNGARASADGRTMRTRAVLVVAEIALAVILLTGAGLLVKSLVALQNVELGFNPGNVLVMKATGVRSQAENNAFFTQLLPRVAALPGIRAVGATSIPPGDLTLSGDGAYHIDRIPEVRDRDREPHALFTIATPGAFAALGIPITRGRDFTESDTEDRPLVAIVNEALVRESLGDQDPIGRTIFCSWDRKDPMTIVGVVGDARQRSPGLEPMPECDMPYRQHPYNGNTLNMVARIDGDPMALAPAVRRAAADIAPYVPVSFTTMEATMAKRMEEPRFRALLFVVLAGIGGCLAMAGVYGVVAHAVEQRSREICLRMALGASRTAVLQMMLARSVMLAIIGTALGLAGALGATRFIETMLFEVRPLDTSVYLAVVVLVGVVTLLASYVPARRAAVLNPIELLKTD